MCPWPMGMRGTILTLVGCLLLPDAFQSAPGAAPEPGSCRTACRLLSHCACMLCTWATPKWSCRCLTALPARQLACPLWIASEAEPPPRLLLLQKSRRPQRFGGPPRPRQRRPTCWTMTSSRSHPLRSLQRRPSPQPAPHRHRYRHRPHRCSTEQCEAPTAGQPVVHRHKHLKHRRPHRQCPAAVGAACWAAVSRLSEPAQACTGLAGYAVGCDTARTI